MKRVAGWLVGILVVIVLAVVADRIAVGVAENKAVDAIERAADVGDVDVSIHGFPFLTQVIAGSLTEVTGSVSSGSFGGLHVSDVRVDASGVGTSAPYLVDSGTAAGDLALSSLQEILRSQTDLDLTVAADGDALALSTQVLGLDLVVDVIPRVDGPHTLGVTVRSVRLAGATVSIKDLPSGIENALTDMKIALTLPAGISLTGVSVGSDAVRISASGQQVALEDLIAS